jgi:hypothetical protein
MPFTKHLPNGQLFILRGFPRGAITEVQIQDVIRNRTGVTIPLDRISVSVALHDKYNSASMISLTNEQVGAILTWVLSEDSVAGVPLCFELPPRVRSWS